MIINKGGQFGGVSDVGFPMFAETDADFAF